MTIIDLEAYYSLFPGKSRFRIPLDPLMFFLPHVLSLFTLFTYFTQPQPHLFILFTTCHLVSLFYSFDMGNQKTAAKRKSTSGHSGTRKSKENAPPTGMHSRTPKPPYPKPRPAHKTAATASTNAYIGNDGEAAAVAALVSLRQPDSPETTFERNYGEFFRDLEEEDIMHSEPSENDDEGEDQSEGEEDQLMESENDSEGNGKLQHLCHLTSS